MMQSILLTAPSNNSTPEVKKEFNKTDPAGSVDEANGEDQASKRFATMLDGFIEGEETGTDSLAEDLLDGVVEEESLGNAELAGEELTDKLETELDLNPENSPEDSDEMLEADKIETIEQVLPDVKHDNDQGALASGKEYLQDTSIDSEYDAQETQEKALPAILAQIENAQKTDTKLKASDKEGAEFAFANTNKATKGTKTLAVDTSKLNAENVLSDSEDVSEELQLKDSLRHNDKLDNIISSLRAEADKPIFNHNQGSSGLSTLTMGATASGKLFNQTTSSNMLTQQNALQQPIELQAKHASAMVGERILMMLAQGKQEVTIRLDPAELGSMLIKLQVQQDQLQVTIQTQMGQSRDIIEQNLPRLREQLAQQGINLSEANVEQQSKQQQSNSQESQQTAASLTRGEEAMLDEQSEWLTTQIPLPAQGIDYYA